MKISERIAFLTDWAWRDQALALAQARLDDAKAPGILAAVERQLELRERFARDEGDSFELLAQMVGPLPLVRPEKRRK